VITNDSVEQNSLTTSQLRRIFTMRQTYWADNQSITIFVLPNQHALHKSFSKERLEIYPYQLERIWNKLTYSGLGVAPTVVKNPEALIQAVLSTPGSIGYADKKILTLLFTKGFQDKDYRNRDKNIDKQANSLEVINSKGGLHVVNISD